MSNDKQSMKLYIKEKIQKIILIYSDSVFLKESTLLMAFLLLLWGAITFEFVLTAVMYVCIIGFVYFIIRVIIPIIKNIRR